MWARLILGCGLIAAAGCGGEPTRKPLYGNVVGGKSPILAVTFRPTKDTPGPACTAQVEGAAYRFTTEDGPRAGTYQVVAILAEPPATFSGPATTRAKEMPAPVRGQPVLPKPPPPPPMVDVVVPAAAPYELHITLP